MLLLSQEYPPWWFWIHMPLGMAAFIGGVIGVAFGAKQTSDPGSLYSAHKVPSLLPFALLLFRHILGHC